MDNVLQKLKKYLVLFFKHHFYIMPLLVVIDIASKLIMESYLLSIDSHQVEVIKDFFYLTLVYNPGSFSGFLGSSTFGTFILMLLSIAGGIGGIVLLYKKWNVYSKFTKAGFYLLIPGAFGNLFDRFLSVIGVKPGVIDFLHFYLPIIGSFNVFNFADICLTISIVIIIIGIFLDDYKKSKKEDKIN